MRMNRLLTILFLAAFFLSSCSLPGAGIGAPTQVNVDAIYTAAAETLQAQLTQSAGSQPPSEQAPAQAPTETPAPAEASPTETPTPAFTDTPAFTPTPLVPMVIVNTNANCRKGPSSLYNPPVIVLRNGDKAEIHGRNPDRSWWYILIPGKSDQYCWVWGNNVDVQGDTGNVQVVTPPPVPITPTFTPTPDVRFDASFDNVHECDSDPYAIFELDNEGDLDFESMRLVIHDTTDDDKIYDKSSNAPFMGAGSECPPGGDVFPAGKTFFVGGNIADGGSGHDGEATITLCTKEDRDGICVEEDVKFDIP